MTATIVSRMAYLDLRAKRGDRLYFQADLFEDAAATVEWDLTIYDTMRLHIVTAYGNPPTIEADLTSGLSVSDTNRLTIDIAASEMAVAAGRYYYDVEGVKASTTTDTVLGGEFVLTPDATR